MPIYSSPEMVEDELHQLLLRATPRNELGHKTIKHLASLMGVNRWAIQKWILRKTALNPKRVNQLVEIGKMDLEEGDPPDGRVTRADFEKFVYND